MASLIIAIGTISKQKINYINEVLNEIELSAKTVSIKVRSQVSEQPITEKETKQGSINRAKNAIKEFPKADIGLGIEVGYHKYNNYKMFCYATISDKKNKLISCKSHEFVLPEFHNNKINSNEKLGNHVKDYFPEEVKGPKKYIHDMIRYRKPFIIEAVRSVLLEYLSRD